MILGFDFSCISCHKPTELLNANGHKRNTLVQVLQANVSEQI